MTSRRNFLKNIALGAAAGTLVLPSCKLSDKEVTITILHTNDVHSHIDPFPKDHSKYPNQGGFARRSALIKQIRNNEDHVLLLDSGDIFQGTPYFNFYKGELDIKLMNMMQYDASTIGNHEFDNGVEELAKQLKKAEFPFINSNYGLENSILKDLTQPYKIIEKGGVKIGIIGLGIELHGLVDPSKYKDIQYNDPIEVGDKVAGYLKNEEGCDYVIALSHLGYNYDSDKVCDLDVAKNTEFIDLILGGHTHTFLDEPTIVKNKTGKDVVINQTGWAGVKLGRIDIVFSSDKNTQRLAYHKQL